VDSDREGAISQHVPVLLQEVVDWLVPNPSRFTLHASLFIDCTLGGGGHAEALLAASGPDGRLLGLDADSGAIAVASERLAPFGSRAVLVNANFRELAGLAEAHHFHAVDGIVIDLGLSSRQLEGSGRGFTFRHDEPLDMRFDARGGETAADILNRADERELADLLYTYGEEHRSRRIARAIVWRRRRAPFATTGDLVRAVESAVGPRRGRINPATKTFQALRIAVNDELEALDAVLPAAASLLAPGGRLAVISFHSLEDRRVKQFFQAGGTEAAPLQALTRRPVTAGERELQANPRARSAKLRVAERRATRGGTA
jgi:16S rRNA (cytosine1402-N4)-methyltransferase